MKIQSNIVMHASEITRYYKDNELSINIEVQINNNIRFKNEKIIVYLTNLVVRIKLICIFYNFKFKLK